MIKKNNAPTVGIIGCGPRGLSALEALYVEAFKKETVLRTIVFESSKYPGAGPVYALDQKDSNWLNVSERAIGIPKRKEAKFQGITIPAFPDFQNWSGYIKRRTSPTDMDRFPLRSKMGEYLNERFKSIAEVLLAKGLMKYVQREVMFVDLKDNGFDIEVIGGKRYRSDELVLSIGHQPIELDEQLSTWQIRVRNLDRPRLFTQPYPIHNVMEAVKATGTDVVAVRGFGLAMIDLLRGLTEGMGGKFEVVDENSREMRYIDTQGTPSSIVPFSLNGLPMAPKPLNDKIDDRYVPRATAMNRYECNVRLALNAKALPTTAKFLIIAIAPIITSLYLKLGDRAREHSHDRKELERFIIEWLLKDDYEHPLIIPKSMTAADMMKRFVAMATGHGKISLDYCIGQVWRHCQPTMYRLLSFSPLADETIADIIGLDERLKRYSYGPPVDSLQQLLALVRAKKVDLTYVFDPNVELGDIGWVIGDGNKAIMAGIMVNSVLDAPQILKVVSPLPEKLINGSLVEPLHDELGIRTGKDATVERKSGNANIRFAVLGRLAKGSLIGVDAIAECFGERSELWAKGVLERCVMYS